MDGEEWGHGTSLLGRAWSWWWRGLLTLGGRILETLQRIQRNCSLEAVSEQLLLDCHHCLC